MAAPHVNPKAEAINSYRGQFWIPGEAVSLPHGTAHKGPLFVEWEVLDPNTTKTPLVLIHGGGGQGTDWLSTVDGKPGWARYFVEAGYPVYVVDRVGHGRSPYHPDVIGPMGGAFPYEAAVGLFVSPDLAEQQTQWPWGREGGDPQFDQLVSGFGPLPEDFGYSQQLDAERLGRLLDRIGPAILVTHSAGGPVGWLTNDQRPELVKAIVSVEPLGPEFVEFPGMGTLSWGLAAAPIKFDPPMETLEEVQNSAPEDRKIPSLRDKDVVVVAGGASVFAGFAPAMVETLKHAGARAELMSLPDHGIEGNGHALQLEANASENVTPVIEWLNARNR